MSEKSVFHGKIGEVIHTTMPDNRVFEKYRRPPGVRLVIISPDTKILVTKELRHELNNYDLRLPGGKVADSIDDYHQLLDSGQSISHFALEAAKKEATEEVGIEIFSPELLVIANAGATVEWDLYYFLVEDYQQLPHGQSLEYGEDIEVTWMTIDEIKKSIVEGNFSEWRSVGVLLGKVIPYLEKKSKIIN